MRDTFDEDDLCHDLMGFWDSQGTDATLLVWGVPWNPWNWEVTEGSARRGETLLVWRDVLC